MKYCIVLMSALQLFLSASASAQNVQRPMRVNEKLVKAEYRDLSYGPYESCKLDIWLAKNDKPTPVVVFFHGGGFRAGDKSQIHPAMLNELLKAGISVAAANYRLTGVAPFPAQMHDAARAIQFLKSRANEWNLDKKRFAAFGGSAGAGISMWLAFHDDLAEPDSNDPIARESTRLACAGSMGGQCTYDPRVMKQMFGPMAMHHPALFPFYGVKSIEDFNRPEIRKLMAEASPITHLTKDDPPVFCEYYQSNIKVDANTPQNVWVHHPRFGIMLEKRMKTLGVECALQYPGYKNHNYKNMLDFFIKKLKALWRSAAEPAYPPVSISMPYFGVQQDSGRNRKMVGWIPSVVISVDYLCVEDACSGLSKNIVDFPAPAPSPESAACPNIHGIGVQYAKCIDHPVCI